MKGKLSNEERRARERLYRSFDQPPGAREQEALSGALESSQALRQEKSELEALRAAVSGLQPAAFKPMFADRVMRRIRAVENNAQDLQADFFESLIHIFRPVAYAAMLLVAALMIVNFISGGGISLENALALPQVTMEDAYSLNDLIAGAIQ